MFAKVNPGAGVSVVPSMFPCIPTRLGKAQEILAGVNILKAGLEIFLALTFTLLSNFLEKRIFSSRGAN